MRGAFRYLWRCYSRKEGGWRDKGGGGGGEVEDELWYSDWTHADYSQRLG